MTEQMLLCVGGSAHGRKVPHQGPFLRVLRPPEPRLFYDSAGYAVGAVYETIAEDRYVLKRIVFERNIIEVYRWEKFSDDEFINSVFDLFHEGFFGRLRRTPITMPPLWIETELLANPVNPARRHRGTLGVMLDAFGNEILSPKKNRGALNCGLWTRRLLQLKLTASWVDDYEFWNNESQPWSD